MKPTVIGIGVQKCATSWMHSVLGAHPQIGVSDPKEVDFFSYYFDRGYSWYERHFDHLQKLEARCDTSPSYFYDPRAAVRALEYRSDLKVIALLRDPVDRARGRTRAAGVMCSPMLPASLSVWRQGQT